MLHGRIQTTCWGPGPRRLAFCQGHFLRCRPPRRSRTLRQPRSRFPPSAAGQATGLAGEPYVDDFARRKLTVAHALLERTAADLERLRLLLNAPELNREAVHRPLNDAIQFTLYVLEELAELHRSNRGPVT